MIQLTMSGDLDTRPGGHAAAGEDGQAVREHADLTG